MRMVGEPRLLDVDAAAELLGGVRGGEEWRVRPIWDANGEKSGGGLDEDDVVAVVVVVVALEAVEDVALRCSCVRR